MTHTKQEEVEELAKAAHLKWLAKAETAVIKGSEMTVLPYGYLQTAVTEALTTLQRTTRIRALEEVQRKIEDMEFVNPSEAGQFALHTDGYNQALEEVGETLIDLIQAEKSEIPCDGECHHDFCEGKQPEKNEEV